MSTKWLIAVLTIMMTAQAQTPPGVDDAKRAIDAGLQEIWKSMGSTGKRTVLFQSVFPEEPTAAGSWHFRASLTIHDQETGKAATRNYGRTCVASLENETYELRLDDAGIWEAQGRMTPDLGLKTCKDNPAAGVSAIPLSTLEGTTAPQGGPARAAAPPPRKQTATETSHVIPLKPGQGIAPGSYECWGNGQARPLLNFTALGNNQYRDSQGHEGSMSVASNGRVTIRGGNLDGFLPEGYYAEYYAPRGRATLSFRNSSDHEVQYCEKQ